MDSAQLMGFLLRCAAINYAIIIAWFAAFWLAHDALFRLHSRWFHLTHEHFDALNYGGIAAYKILNMVLFMVPVLALWRQRG